MRKKIISQCAEALIYLERDKIIKERIKKPYRISEIDNKLRERRTKSEKKIIEKAGKIINVPFVFDSKDKTKIIMSKIVGEKLSLFLDIYDLEKQKKIFFGLGKDIALLHDRNIIHCDLTTSNMLYSEIEGKLYIIDFGLSFISSRFEDKAVDIHVLKQALESRHFRNFNILLKEFFHGYKNSMSSEKVLNQLEKVEKRGRYKH